MTARGTRPGEHGFTLLEALIGTSLLMVLLATIGLALEANHRSQARGESKAAAQRAARHALSAIAREVRMAGYFPENFASTPPSPPLGDAVQLATDGALALHGDLDASGTSAVFLYCLDGTSLRRGRAPAGETAAYWCPAGEVVTDDVVELRFDYYGEDDVPIPAGSMTSYTLDGQAAGGVPDFSDTTQRAAVRRVAIAMTVERQVRGQGAVRFPLATEVWLRNVQ